MTHLHIRTDDPDRLFEGWLEVKEKEIGAGTFGKVYKGFCKVDGPDLGPDHQRMRAGHVYAVKVEELKTEKHKKNAAHEIEILRRVRSSMCITLFDAFLQGNKVYIVLEFVDGGELFDVIIERGRLTEEEALDITRQLVEALIYLHCESIVHRDLKPENILINKASMRIKLIDFGFAKFFGRKGDHSAELLCPPTPNMQSILAGLSPGGVIPPSPILATPLGSLKYLAPEMLRALVSSGVAPRVTTRTDIQKLDIFAVGVVVYVMMGGTFPFSSKTKLGLTTQIERGLRFTDKFAEVTPEAKDFCKQLMHPDRRQRPSAIECLNHPWLRRPPPPPGTPSVELPPLQREMLEVIAQRFEEQRQDECNEMKTEPEPDASAPPAAETSAASEGAQQIATRPQAAVGFGKIARPKKSPVAPPPPQEASTESSTPTESAGSASQE